MNQSFREVFVSNASTLLAQGSTVDNLGVGQIGILDGKSFLATSAPTYATNKALAFVWGQPDIADMPLMSGQINSNIYSKLIKGKQITNFRGKKAVKFQNQVLSVGFTGAVNNTDTLIAKAGERKHLYLKLTGAAIDKLYSRQGITRMFTAEAPCSQPCGDSCAQVDAVALANNLAKQINQDTYINRFVKATVNQAPSVTFAANAYRFTLTVPDAGDNVSLGIVQAQYPTAKVTSIFRQGIQTTYQVIIPTNTLPSAFTNAGLTIIPDCPTCPAGYTLSSGQFVYVVTRADAGTAGALTQINTDYAVTGTETAVRITYNFGTSTYVIRKNTVVSSAVGVDTLQSLGLTRNACVITTPTTYAWVLAETMNIYSQKYRVTVADSICGVNRLTDIQAAYPSLVITLVTPSGSCVNTYEATVNSQPVSSGCSVDVLQLAKPAPFLGNDWVINPAITTPQVVAPVNVVGTPATTGGALAAGTYYYIVTALNAIGETTGSIEVPVTTTTNTSVVNLTWAGSVGATSYRVYRGTTSLGENIYFTTTTASFSDTGAVGVTGTPPVTSTAVINAPVQSAATTSTTGGTFAAGTYFYVVTALTAAGETVKSNEVSITTTGTTSSNTVNWAAVVGATGYRIYRGTATGAENAYYAVGAVTSFVDTNAASTAGTPPVTNTASIAAPVQSALSTSITGGTFAAGTYFYVVTALNANGETLKSNEQSIVTTGTTSSNTVSWAAVTGATGYRVYRGTAAAGENIYYAVGNVTSFVDTGAASTAGTPPTVNTTASTSILAGIRLEVIFNRRITNEVTYDYFPYEMDTIYLQASSFDPDYNASPEKCVNPWAVRQIQQPLLAAGYGASVRDQERQALSYHLRERSFDPVVRALEGYQFQADPYTYYDEYTLEFQFKYKTGGWAQEYIDNYELHVFFPTGTGKNFEAAINGYISSAALQIDPVVL